MADVDLAEIRKSCLESLYSNVENIFKYLDETKEEELEKIRSCVQSHCHLDSEQNASQKALEIVKLESDLNSFEGRYHEEFANNIPAQINYASHPYMIELEKHIEAAESRYRVSDDLDIEITDERATYIDQITKLLVVNPVKNALCHHVYEMSTIREFIKGKKRKCPHPGCKNSQYIREEHLVSDEELRRTLSQQQDTQEAQLI